MADETKYSLVKRFYIYQKERFPFAGNVLVIAVFTFSALSYSRICRGATGFVDIKTYLIGVCTTVLLFFLVRIFDEHKDAEDDAKYRQELPVPRGLISLKELRIFAIVAFCIQVLVNLIFAPKMLVLYFIAFGYLCLMGKEFFVVDWLRKRQVWYVVSHMLIVPLIDVYASGLDWFMAGVKAPIGLVFFFVVSFMNGIVLEVGRKIRTPEKEKEGVVTYSGLYGAKKATWIWIITLVITLIAANLAAYYAGYSIKEFMVLGCGFILCLIPAFLFLNQYTEKRGKYIEYASIGWTFLMYLTLGGIPMLIQLLTGK